MKRLKKIVVQIQNGVAFSGRSYRHIIEQLSSMDHKSENPLHFMELVAERHKLIAKGSVNLNSTKDFIWDLKEKGYFSDIKLIY